MWKNIFPAEHFTGMHELPPVDGSCKEKGGGGRQEYIREGMRWILSLETEQGMGMCRRFYGLEEMAGVFLPERFHHELSLRLIDAEYLSGHSGAV